MPPYCEVNYETCICDLPFNNHPGAALLSSLCAMGEAPCRRNSARCRRQAESFGACATNGRRAPGTVWGMGSCEWRQVCSEYCGGSQAGRCVRRALGQGTRRSTPGRIAFGGGSDCKLPAARRAPDQCLTATLEDHPKTGFHSHSV